MPAGWPRRLAVATITIGLMMSVLGEKFVGYVSFDSVADANRAAAILGDLGSVTSAELKAAAGK